MVAARIKTMMVGTPSQSDSSSSMAPTEPARVEGLYISVLGAVKAGPACAPRRIGDTAHLQDERAPIDELGGTRICRLSRIQARRIWVLIMVIASSMWGD